MMFFNCFSRGHQADSGSPAALGGKKALKYFLTDFSIHPGAGVFNLIHHRPSLRLQGPEGYISGMAYPLGESVSSRQASMALVTRFCRHRPMASDIQINLEQAFRQGQFQRHAMGFGL